MKADHRIVVRTVKDARRVMELLREAYDRRVVKAGQTLQVEIGLHKPPRTGQQNALMHLWFGEIAEQTGHTPEEVKDWCKGALLPQEPVTINGRMQMRHSETSRLSKAACCDFLDGIAALAADMGFELTQPDPGWFRRFRLDADRERIAAGVATEGQVQRVQALGADYASALAGHVSGEGSAGVEPVPVRGRG